jgi:hypothetical protein
MDSSNRQLRARHEALAELVDRAPRRGGGGTARRLVQVYDGGSMGAAPDLFYLTHPVELDGSEVEGGTGTPVVDTDQTIPVVVLWHAPAVGDLLTAYAVGGRWVAERGGAGGGMCDVTFRVGCCASGLYGGPTLTVSVYDSTDTTLLATGTTTTGSLTLSWSGASGIAHHVHVTGQSAGFNAYNVSQVINCGTTVGLTLTVATGYTCCVCCEPFKLSDTLTVSYTLSGTPATKTMVLESPCFWDSLLISPGFNIRLQVIDGFWVVSVLIAGSPYGSCSIEVGLGEFSCDPFDITVPVPDSCLPFSGNFHITL